MIFPRQKNSIFRHLGHTPGDACQVRPHLKFKVALQEATIYSHQLMSRGRKVSPARCSGC